MKKGLFTLLLLIITVLPAMAAPTNTTGPWGIDVSTFSSISSAKRSPATVNKTMVVTTVMDCGDLIIPADRELDIKKGGKIRYSGNLIILGSFKSGLYESLEPVGAGTLIFGPGSVHGVYPEWFGTNAVPGNTDMTAAIHTAAAVVKASKAVLLLTGKYGVTKIKLYDAVDYSIQSFNARLIAISGAVQTAVLEIENAYNFRMSGALSIEGHTTYTSGLRLTTSLSGSAIGAITRVNIRDITFRLCGLALAIGSFDSDRQLSELVFNNIEMLGCPAAVYSAGSQAGASFIGCNLVSEPSAHYPGAEEYILKMEGGFITIVGGEMVQAAPTVGTSRAAIIFNPGSSSTYNNPYPIFRVTGTHIEITGDTKLFEISNPRALLSPASAMFSHIVFTSSGGYVGSVVTTIAGSILDTTYAGRIQFKNNTFYTSGSVRTADTINSASALAIIDIDKNSFGSGYLGWVEGSVGGIISHELIVGVYADNLSGITISPSASGTLIYGGILATGNYKRYASGYNTTTGIFTVPAGGIKNVTLRASAKVNTGNPLSIAIYRNSALDVTGSITGSAMNVAGDYIYLSAGDTLEVRVTNSSGPALTFGANAFDRLTISMQN